MYMSQSYALGSEHIISHSDDILAVHWSSGHKDNSGHTGAMYVCMFSLPLSREHTCTYYLSELSYVKFNSKL